MMSFNLADSISCHHVVIFSFQVSLRNCFEYWNASYYLCKNYGNYGNKQCYTWVRYEQTSFFIIVFTYEHITQVGGICRISVSRQAII